MRPPAFIRYKNGLAGVAVAVGFADGAPNFECQVICANGTLRFNQHGADGRYVRVGRGDRWEEVPFEDAPHEMHHEWKGFVEAIERDVEPPAHGEYGRHVMEILFAAGEVGDQRSGRPARQRPGVEPPGLGLSSHHRARLDIEFPSVFLERPPRGGRARQNGEPAHLVRDKPFRHMVFLSRLPSTSRSIAV